MSANQWTIAAARDALRKGEISAVDLTMSCLTAMDAGDDLNAFVFKTPEIALEQARAADARIKAGEAPAMCGIPLGIKDLFCTKGVPSQAASNILKGFRPEYESTVTTQLFGAGAVMLGKLNMDEFAMGSSNETSCYGNAVNPWRREGSNVELTPGGSSGGSAAAVAADLCLAATGTDTGGSIRQPAAFTGIVGIKPTYGRVSRWGVVAFASSLDQAGPMTKTVRDAAIMLQAMCGHDPKDSTSADIPVPDFEAALTGDIRGKVIGIPKEYRMDGMPAEIEALWSRGIEMLKDAGAEVRDISLPHTKYALPAYYVIAPAEASSNLARYDGVRYGHRAKLAQGDGITEMYEKTRAEGFGPEVQRRVMVGTYVLSRGVLRRLLQPRAEGAGADQARLRGGFRGRGRCDPDASDALGGVWLGRDGRCRSGADVSQRHLHGDGEPRRAAGHCGAGGAGRAGVAAWAAADRAALGRGGLAELRTSA
jgi:aspartyl-tRNA(Asn)/glutamyl-tRNA(Gln) amidotransferase subunit A